MFFSNITDYYKDKFMLSYGTLLTAAVNYRYKASTYVNVINNNIDRADIFWLIFWESLGKKRGTILSVGCTTYRRGALDPKLSCLITVSRDFTRIIRFLEWF